MNSSTLQVRRTTEADLEFVVTAERHPDNRSFVGQWSHQQHVSACSDPEFWHYVLWAQVPGPPSAASWVVQTDAAVAADVSQQVVHQLEPSSGDHGSVRQRAQARAQTRVGYLILQGATDGDRNLQIRRLVVTHKGLGYGRLALRWAKHMAFEQWMSHRLWLDVKTYNPRARALYESEGFVYEGTLRECVQVGDRFESLAILSILRSEYAALTQS